MRHIYCVVLVLFVSQFSLNAQSVIVNEVSQGSDGGKEWVELLVVDPGVNLIGWELGDNDDGNWHSIATFNDHSDWSSVAAGTIIVIYNSGDVDGNIISAGGEDTDYSDKSVIIPINNTTYVTDTGPWGLTGGAFANSDGGDCPAIRDADDVIIHDMAVTHGTATVPGPGSTEVKYYTSNTAAGTADNSNWVEAASTEATPGSGNGGDNSNWTDNSLPVELSSWTATTIDGQVNLEWITESEFENQGFILSRSTSSNVELAETWTNIATFTSHKALEGNGSTQDQNSYSFTDFLVEAGQAYIYLLSDVDYQGRVTKHDEIHVTVPSIKQSHKSEGKLLLPIYPNPFNSEVTIPVVIPPNSSDPTQIDVYNIRGVLIESIMIGSAESGVHSVIWNARKFPSGVYIIKLAKGKSTDVQRLLLLR